MVHILPAAPLGTTDQMSPDYAAIPLNHHRGRAIREWCDANAVELVFTPTYASWANPIEAHFGPLRQFVIANSDYPDHPAPGPSPPRLPALAQREHTRPRPPRSRTPPPSPHPQRTTTTLGPHPPRRLKRANVCGQSTRCRLRLRSARVSLRRSTPRRVLTGDEPTVPCQFVPDEGRSRADQRSSTVT
jgi:hypothetical protein